MPGQGSSALRSTHVAMMLRKAIRRGEFAVGEWLPTTRDLAVRYRVSRHTIHNALKQLERDDLVEYQARRGGIVKASPTATAAVPSRTRRIGILMTGTRESFGELSTLERRASLGQGWSSRIIAAVQMSLVTNGYEPTLVPFIYSASDAIDRDHLDNLIREWRNDLAGMVLMPGEVLAPVIEAFDLAKKPWVTINRPSVTMQQNFVAPNHYEAGRWIGWCAARLNRLRTLVLPCRRSIARSSEDNERLYGVVQGFIDAGAPLTGIINHAVVGRFNEDYDCLAELFDRGPIPQIIVTEGDLTAAAALRLCRDRGHRVPEDVLIFGPWGEPPIIGVDQSLQQVGATAATMMLDMLRTGQRHIPGRLISCQLCLPSPSPVSPRIWDDFPGEVVFKPPFVASQSSTQ